MVRAVAITGGIGSGKSSVVRSLEARGFVTIDADRLAREAVTLPGISDSIRTEFGETIFNADGTLARERLRETVFVNPSKRKRLEEILHPAIAGLFVEKRGQLTRLAPGCWIFYEAALIVEAGRAAEFDALVTVVATEERRLSWLHKARGMERDEAQRIMSSQLSDDEKRKVSHFVLENDGDLTHLEQHVDGLLAFLRERFAAPNFAASKG